MVVFLALWEGSLRLFDVPQFILPTPIEIIERIVKDAVTGLIFVHVQVTVMETLFGFLLAAILGVGLGCAVGLLPRFERIVYPYILALQTIPKVAVAPLMIIWVGYGIQSKILTAGLIAFFPILVNVVVGLKTVEPRMLLLMRALKAGHIQTFIKVRLPSMLPYLFAGLKRPSSSRSLARSSVSSSEPRKASGASSSSGRRRSTCRACSRCSFISRLSASFLMRSCV